LSVAENQPVGTTVGTLSTVDPDAGGTFTYSLVAGMGSADNGQFTISGALLKTAAVFDYELMTKKSYSIRIRSTDQGGLYKEKMFTIGVTDVNDSGTAALMAGATTLPLELAGESALIPSVAPSLSRFDMLTAVMHEMGLATGQQSDSSAPTCPMQPLGSGETSAVDRAIAALDAR